MKIRLDDTAFQPTRAHATDAGLDLYAMHNGIVRAGQSATFHTGVHVQLPDNTAGVLLPKSGLMLKNLVAFGVVDQGYTGEILVHMFNHGGIDYSIRAGDKIAQMLVMPVLYEPVELVEALSGGERGNDGFGSTGR